MLFTLAHYFKHSRKASPFSEGRPVGDEADEVSRATRTCLPKGSILLPVGRGFAVAFPTTRSHPLFARKQAFEHLSLHLKGNAIYSCTLFQAFKRKASPFSEGRPAGDEPAQLASGQRVSRLRFQQTSCDQTLFVRKRAFEHLSLHLKGNAIYSCTLFQAF